MKPKSPFAAASVLISLATLAAPAAAGTPVEVSRLPFQIRDAAGKVVPAISLTSAALVAERGQKVYALQGTDTKGRNVTVDVTERGEVLRVDTPVPMDEVPRAVTDRLHACVKDFDARTVARSVRYGGESIWFVFDGTEKDNPLRVEVSSDGKQMLIEEPDAGR
jgi:hypothetical protein